MMIHTTVLTKKFPETKLIASRNVKNIQDVKAVVFKRLYFSLHFCTASRRICDVTVTQTHR